MNPNAKPSYITPSITRQALHTYQQSYTGLSANDKMLLLQYVLQDGQYEELQGLKLIPVEDGSFAAFDRSAQKLYLPSTEHPSSLLPGENLKKYIVSVGPLQEKGILGHFQQIACTGKLHYN
eukprot:GHVT01073197.1.p1 GENE.GHVT01073197.1~~GHVT01073197.1.p1  ORF type:complete len:134 (+),score=7.21 GHVT01073197.1:38-403(+)